MKNAKKLKQLEVQVDALRDLVELTLNKTGELTQMIDQTTKLIGNLAATRQDLEELRKDRSPTRVTGFADKIDMGS